MAVNPQSASTAIGRREQEAGFRGSKPTPGRYSMTSVNLTAPDEGIGFSDI
jgi:hypothetical protein